MGIRSAITPNSPYALIPHSSVHVDDVKCIRNRLLRRKQVEILVDEIQLGIEAYKSPLMSCDVSFHSCFKHDSNSTQLIDCPTCDPKLQIWGSSRIRMGGNNPVNPLLFGGYLSSVGKWLLGAPP
ncbi:hypothetical protein TNCV_1526861 [Trichonephila clavipes]|nr:hypothetical protein TNCV_1526861 [Trichonephila clavipes]